MIQMMIIIQIVNTQMIDGVIDKWVFFPTLEENYISIHKIFLDEQSFGLFAEKGWCNGFRM